MVLVVHHIYIYSDKHTSACETNFFLHYLSYLIGGSLRSPINHTTPFKDSTGESTGLSLKCGFYLRLKGHKIAESKNHT